MADERGAIMPASKYTEEQRHEALRLVPELGQAETARRLAIPRRTVCRWSSRAGVKSGREKKTEAARQHHIQENALLRAEMARDLLLVAQRLKNQLFAESLAYNFGGKDNTFNEAKLSEPSHRDKQALLTSIGIALDKSLALEKHDADGGQGIAAVDEWLRTVRGR